MLPTLFSIGGLDVPTHAFCLTLGILTATLVMVYEARRRGRLDQELVAVMAGTLLFGAVGAKLATVWQYVRLSPDPTLFGALVDGGKSILGGLAGAYVGALITKKIVGYQGKTGDLFAPGIALGMAVGRVGCFLTEQIGTPTSLPWGISVDAATAARLPGGMEAGVPMHPSFLYEIAFQLLIFAVLWALRDRVPVPGELFKIYLVTYGSFRFLVEFVRGNEVMWSGLSGSQLFLIPSTLLLLAYFYRQISRGAYRSGPAPSLSPAGEPA
ncbi:MAG TPA: prolipoprotein diacylglyceryl transferase family protein [Propionicimonas sp.]|nr:prolipoprotein diacylglyceryl transferase family protein [Propionicimonas sp.]